MSLKELTGPDLTGPDPTASDPARTRAAGRRRAVPQVGPAGWREVGVAVLLLVVGALVVAEAFTGAAAIPVLLGSAILPVALIVGLTRLRVSVWAAATLVVAGAVLGGYAATRDSGSISPLLDALPRLLTAPSPAPARPDLLAPGAILIVVVATGVAVRLTRARRWGVTALLGAVLLYVAGQLLTAGQADRYGVAAVALVALAAIGWLARGSSQPPVSGSAEPDTGPEAAAGRADPRSTGSRRRRGAAVVVLVAAIALLGAIPARVGGFEPRDLVTAPQSSVSALNPMSMLSAWARDPDRDLFHVAGDDYALRLVTLTDFDGVSWRAPTAFVVPSERDHSSLPPGAVTSTVSVEVSGLALGLPWVPVPGTRNTLGSSAALITPETGTTVIPGVDGNTRYGVTGSIDAPDRAALTAAVVPTTGAAERYLAVPGLPSTIRSYAADVTRSATTPLEKAAAIEAAVRGSRTVSTKAPTGSSYYRIEEFLLADPATSPGGQAGTSEQFAGSFAVLARAAGLPTRVVVGFLPGTDDTSSPGARVVRGRDAVAWPEVYFESVGWVPFSPTPDTARLGPDISDRAPIGSPAPTGTAAPTATPSPVGPAAAPVAVTPVAGGLSVWWAPALAVLVLLATVLVLLFARRVRRSGHRREAAPGAWDHLLEVAAISGAPRRRGQSALALAQRLDAAPSGPAGEVAQAAERATFGPPRRGSEPEVWAQVALVERAARGRLPWWRRGLWWIDPRPLFRRRR